MPEKPIAIASDHGGFELKSLLIEEIRALGHQVLDLGCHGPESVDYPDYAAALAAALADGRADRGVILCGTGIGISIAANRHPHVRAALCHNGLTARLARQHNDANVLALGGRILGPELAKDCLREFLATPFEGGRHARRVAKLAAPVNTREKV
ncbi:MAG: ribose 5-phosphate isomerase B [Proteobacteria bacterium]|nr:MAG: ribose 5-phosphate isomerase B [Pseudomonadota bacterium]